MSGRRSIAYWVFAALGAAGLLLFGLFFLSVFTQRGRPKSPQWAAGNSADGYFIRRVEAGGAAAGILSRDDQLLAVNGKRSVQVYGPELTLARVPLGKHYTIEFRHGDTVRTAQLQMRHDAEFSAGDIGFSLFVVVLLYVVGSAIGLMKPDDPIAKRGAATFLLGALYMARPLIGGFCDFSTGTASAGVLLLALSQPWHLPVSYDFLSRFPAPMPEGPTGRLVRQCFYAMAGVFWLGINVPMIAQLLGVPALPEFSALEWIDPHGKHGSLLMMGFEALAGAAMCVALVRNYLRVSEPDSRRKLRWAGLGLACALFPFLVIATMKLALALAGNVVRPPVFVAIDRIGTAMVVLAPIMLAYAVVKHRVLGIHVVIRQGLQYLLAKNVLRAIVLVPVLIVITDAILHPQWTFSDLLLRRSWTFYVLLTATAAFSLRYRKQMSEWLDRKFFRVAYEQEQVLGAVIEHIKAAESEDEIAAIVARELEKTLSTAGVHVLMRTGDAQSLRPVYSYPAYDDGLIRNVLSQQPPETDISSGAISLFEWDGKISLERPMEAKQYQEALIVPLAGAGRKLVGMLVLGPKKSDEPYSRRDRDVLQAIAGQMTMMYEVLRLKQRVSDEERIRVQVLGRLERESIQLLNECPRCGRCFRSEQSICPYDSAALSLTLPVERVVEDKYRLDRRIGKGGMGVVYEALDMRLHREVAVKIMTGEFFGNQYALLRFEREARTIARLRHPNVVNVHDFGRIAAGGAYLVMELVAGRSWRQELTSGRLDPTRVSLWFEQLCSAVAAAHALGIVHRDLKPENVMIGKGESEDRIVVLDFGLAKALEELTHHESNLTGSGVVMGSRGYMSPEQNAGQAVDGRADVYAIGVMAVETITGRRPPHTGGSIEWMRDSLKRAGKVEGRLSRILEQALAPDPAGRMASALDLGDELSQLLQESASVIPASANQTNIETERADQPLPGKDFR